MIVTINSSNISHERPTGGIKFGGMELAEKNRKCNVNIGRKYYREKSTMLSSEDLSKAFSIVRSSM